MATQIIKTMRSKVEPNPKGSATSHVTMPSANPFERETISIRAANAPEMLPGMGDFWGDFQSGVTGGTTTEAGTGSAGGWGSFFGKLTDSVVDVGSSYAKSEIQKDQMKDLQKQKQEQDLQSTMMNLLTANQMAKMKQPSTTQMSTTNPQLVPVGIPQPRPAPSSGLSKSVPLIVGAVALVAVGGYFLMNKGKGKGRSRRRRR